DQGCGGTHLALGRPVLRYQPGGHQGTAAGRPGLRRQQAGREPRNGVHAQLTLLNLVGPRTSAPPGEKDLFISTLKKYRIQTQYILKTYDMILLSKGDAMNTGIQTADYDSTLRLYNLDLRHKVRGVWDENIPLINHTVIEARGLAAS